MLNLIKDAKFVIWTVTVLCLVVGVGSLYSEKIEAQEVAKESIKSLEQKASLAASAIAEAQVATAMKEKSLDSMTESRLKIKELETALLEKDREIQEIQKKMNSIEIGMNKLVEVVRTELDSATEVVESVDKKMESTTKAIDSTKKEIIEIPEKTFQEFQYQSQLAEATEKASEMADDRWFFQRWTGTGQQPAPEKIQLYTNWIMEDKDPQEMWAKQETSEKEEKDNRWFFQKWFSSKEQPKEEVAKN